jgi:uncharacterized membrane protein
MKNESRLETAASAMMSLGLFITLFVFIGLPILFVLWVISPVFMVVMIAIVVAIGYLAGRSGSDDA